MRIVIVSQHFWPESFRINDVAADLAAQGCEVTILTGQPNYPEGSIYPGYRAGQFRRERYRGAMDVFRVPLIPRGKGGGVRLAANYLSFLAAATVFGPWVLRGRPADVVFVYGTSPILQAIAGWVLKLVKRAPLVVWVQDQWPQSLEVTGFVRDRRVLGLVAMVVRWIYRRADLVLVQSRAFEQPVGAMAGRTPVEYHPNPGEPLAANHDPAAPRVPLDDDAFNVVFAGNLGTVQALDTVVEAADLLRSRDDIRIVLVGAGSRLDWLREEVERRGLRNVQLPGKYPPASMPDLMRRASALLVSLSRQPILAETVPSKLQTYLASGTPIVACLDGEGARIVREAHAGLACPAEDPRALSEAILALRAAGPQELTRMGESGRRYFVEHFEPAMLARRLVARLRCLQGQR